MYVPMGPDGTDTPEPETNPADIFGAAGRVSTRNFAGSAKGEEGTT